MHRLKQLIGSIVSSYFGPHKSNKLVVDDDKHAYMIRCPVLLLQKMNVKDHLICLIEETLDAHHKLYGCSSISLLTMWYLWAEEFEIALQEGCEITDFIDHSQSILEHVISHLSEIMILCAETFLGKQDIKSKFVQLQKSESFHSQSKGKVLYSSEKPYKKLSNNIPLGIRYSSRHFSPSQSHCTVGNQEAVSVKADEETFEINYSEKYTLTEKLKSSMHTLVEKLSHGDSELTNLVYDVWINKVKNSNSFQFNIDGLVTCPVTLPSSFSAVVDGLIIKTDIRYLPDQDLSIEKCRALIIKGSITYEYTHLGYFQDVSVILKKSPEQLQKSAKSEWIKKCCDLLLDLEINCLLVTGEVDSAIANFCSSNSILLLPCILWSLLQDLCVAVDESPCVYLLECDHGNVILNLKIKQWNFVHAEDGDETVYVHINISNLKSTKKIYSVILCHPNQLLLESQEHQFWHLASRLQLATKENKLLPGEGKTEKWCSDFLLKWAAENETQERIKTILQRGFLNYFEILSQKAQDSIEVNFSASIDEMQSKIQAWRSSMALVLVLLQCDCLVVNGCDGSILDQNFIGYL